MDYKLIISGLLVVAIIIAILFKDKIKTSFMGLKLASESNSRKNKISIKGNSNKVKQGNSSKSAATNTTVISGDENDVDQN